MSVMCSRPSMPPRSTNAPSSVRFLTTPLSTAPSTSFSISASRSSECSLSTTARRETTTLLRLRSSLMSLNSSSLPSRYTGSRTGRTSTSEPGRNARTSLMSTVKPPLTLPLILPVTVSSFSSASSSSSHTMARLAFSRESTVSPKPFSSASSATLTVSPSATSISPSSLRNCSMGTMPSDLSPALMITTSVRTWTTVPVTMAPGLSLARLAWLASNSSANDSVIVDIRLMTQTAARIFGNSGCARRSTRLVGRRGIAHGPHVSVVVGKKDESAGFPAGLGLRRRGSALVRRQQGQHAFADGFDAEAGGVDVDGVRGRPQRRHRAIGVAGVAGENLAQQTRQCNRNSLVAQLFIAPLRALLGAGGQEDLVGGVREDHRPHVAAVRDQ